MANQTLQLVIDRYDTPLQISKWLDELAEFLSEHNEVYECNCEDDPENIRGSYEWDTNAYNHGDNCPTNFEDHYNIVLTMLAKAFKEAQVINGT